MNRDLNVYGQQATLSRAQLRGRLDPQLRSRLRKKVGDSGTVRAASESDRICGLKNPKLWLTTALIWFLSPSWAILLQAHSESLFPLVSPTGTLIRLWTAAYVICEHLSLWLWPFGRDPVLRPLEPESLIKVDLIYWLVLLLLLRHTWRLRKQNPAICLGLVLALVSMLPFAGFFRADWPPFSQYYLLPAGLGLSLMMAGLLFQTAQCWQLSSRQWVWKLCLGIFHILIILWIFARPWETVQRLDRSWEDRVRLTVENDRSNFAAATELGRIEGLKGNDTLAEEWLLAADKRAPWYQGIPIAKAEVLMAQGKPEVARIYLDRFLLQNPGHPLALQLLQKLDSPP